LFLYHPSATGFSVFPMEGVRAIPSIMHDTVACNFKGGFMEQCQVVSCAVPGGGYGCEDKEGLGSCTAQVTGEVGEQVVWTSSCGGSATSIIDGVQDELYFDCSGATENLAVVLPRPKSIYSFVTIMQARDGFVALGNNPSLDDRLAATVAKSGLGISVTKLAWQAQPEDRLLLLGGPCSNPLTAELWGLPFHDEQPSSNCALDFAPGRAYIQSFERGSKQYIVVAGQSGEDTAMGVAALVSDDPIIVRLLQEHPMVAVEGTKEYFAVFSPH